VAPQMTLFGPAAPAVPPPAWPPGGVAVTAPAPAGPPATEDLPAFERRERLRNERHRLVAEVRRRHGDSHREINAWLNRKLGITSVEKATLEDLERSVQLLVTRLSARR
jgi:hypothetical protein